MNAKTHNENTDLFGSRNPSSLIEIINDCVHCGFCLSTCPTYIETRNELDSPRGRIYLIKSAIEGKIEIGESLVTHIDRCIGCLACETSCPSGVKYRLLLENAKEHIEKTYKRSLSERLFRWFLFQMFPHPKRLKRIKPLLYLYDKTGMRSLLRKMFPSSLRGLSDMAPSVKKLATIPTPTIAKAANKKRFTVGFLKGCVQDAWFSEINEATIRVLTKNGCDVIIPPEQGCCGALLIHSGRLEEGKKMAKGIIDTFFHLKIDALIVNAAGCGSTLKDYQELLKDDPNYKELAQNISQKSKDVLEFLDEVGLECELKPLNLKVAYQDACHLVHAQGIKDAPRNLLKAIPQLKLVEFPESDYCCGSGGIYNLVQREMSENILRRKIDNIFTTSIDTIAVGNPGCLIQIQKGLRMNSKHNVDVLHPIELLNLAISN